MNSAFETLSGAYASDEPEGHEHEERKPEVSEHEAGEPALEPHMTDTLIKAALSLSQAIEALGSLNIFGEVQPPDVKRGIDFYAEVRRFEVALITEALRVTNGRQARAAALLGLHPTTLNCMIKRFDVDAFALALRPDPRSPRGRRAKKPPVALVTRQDLAPAR